MRLPTNTTAPHGGKGNENDEVPAKKNGLREMRQRLRAGIEDTGPLVAENVRKDAYRRRGWPLLALRKMRGECAIMKALSIKQPWANAILSGHKTLEIRTWATNYRGPLLICASLAPHKSPEYIAPDALSANFLRQLPVVPLGAAIATCNMVDCREMTAADERAAMSQWAPPHGRRLYAFVLADVKRITPFYIRGQLGLFDVEYPRFTKEMQDAEYRKMDAKQFHAEMYNEPKPGTPCSECGRNERKIGALCLDCAGK